MNHLVVFVWFRRPLRAPQARVPERGVEPLPIEARELV